MFEFVVPGIPRTIRTKRSASRDQWRQKVASHASDRLTNGSTYIRESCSATIIYYYRGFTELDVDGIAKLILDGLKQIVYDDDAIVEQILVRKTNQNGLQLSNPPPVLAEALLTNDSLVYVRIDNAPNHSELPI